MEQTLIAQSNLPSACDVFVLSEGAHRYRDALALAVLLRYLGPNRDVQVWPVLSPQEGGDRFRGNLASEQRIRLMEPKGTDRSAIIVGRAELFGPDVEIDLLSRLRPRRPVHMEDTPSERPGYRESEPIGTRRKPFRITPKSPAAPLSVEDQAQVYAGWQSVGDGWRKIVILEGVSALGTIAAVKAFCSPDYYPSQLAGVEAFFVTYDVKLKLRSRGRGRVQCALIKKDSRAAAAVLPWCWDDVAVSPRVKEWRAVAGIEDVGGNVFSFRGTRLPLLTGARNDLRNRVLSALVAHPGEWIKDEDLIEFARGLDLLGGPALALKQVLEFLVAHGLFIECADDRFRHVARVEALHEH